MKQLTESTRLGTAPTLSYRFSWFDWFCLWYPPGWLILFNRHWQHYHADPQGWNFLEYLLFLLPGGFYLASLLRWLRLGGRSPQKSFINLDPEYQQAFREEILAPILQTYFRAELHGVEEIPKTSGPLLVVMNHAGMCFPWDFVGLGVLLSQTQNWWVQPLAHPIFFDHPWLNWWLPPGWSDVLGGVRADSHTFSTVFAQPAETLASGRAVTTQVLLYAPEGWRGLAKGWWQRYRLATFDPSFIRLSLNNHIPILPVLCVGNETLHPWAWNWKRLARWIKLPIFPVSWLMPVFVLFPSMGVWAIRTRLRYQVQPLYYPWKEGSEAAVSPSQSTRTIAYHTAQALRTQLQHQLNHYLRNPLP